MITDAEIREYLLGRLDSDGELVEQIDDRIFSDPKFSINVDVIEDEIIEEYLDGSLKSDDTLAVERHFLRPPERQRKLKTARLFSRYLQAEYREIPLKQPATFHNLLRAIRIGRVLPSFRTSIEIAALAVMLVLIVTVLNQRREFDTAIKQMQQRLGQERERSTLANQQLQNALQSLQPAIAMVNLVRPGLERGEPDMPEVKIGSGTKTLHVEVALLAPASGRCQVQLRHAGKTVWSRDGVEANPVPGGAILKLDIPADVLPQGAGELAIAFSGDGALSYWFSIKKIQ